MGGVHIVNVYIHFQSSLIQKLDRVISLCTADKVESNETVVGQEPGVADVLAWLVKIVFFQRCRSIFCDKLWIIQVVKCVKVELLNIHK